MKIEILPAQVEDKPVLRHLLQLCLHDYSEFNGKEVNAHGLFDYPYLDYYWTEAGRYPFLVRVEGTLAGFVLVRQLELDADEPLWQMAEFFVLSKYRRQGIGREVAHRVFDQFEGRWQVPPQEGNLPVLGFWQRVIEDYQHKKPGAVFLQ
ncbi:GNAT family N-acetyltransferase [Nodosilinea sp. LEGE 07088]|uniref:GNAT family N-acetyltransferase n=1 Tax=Nodosilinea sp. LEGE 07088 TaxID=2777968 RepID=UPI00187F578A|nr:GNAT family N-acetyltransferase [Nodosilinea sp. LEGE 07088]MBE9137020.1 GNAT family N-acetyltransferase [Nodosilinea sp. LEGE 07088]